MSPEECSPSIPSCSSPKPILATYELEMKAGFAFVASDCSSAQIDRWGIAGCRIEVRHKLKEKRETGRAGETSAVEQGSYSAAVVAAGDYYAVAAGILHNSGIAGWRNRRAFLVGKESRGGAGREARG